MLGSCCAQVVPFMLPVRFGPERRTSALVLTLLKTSAEVWRSWGSSHVLDNVQYVPNTFLEILLRFARAFHIWRSIAQVQDKEAQAPCSCVQNGRRRRTGSAPFV